MVVYFMTNVVNIVVDSGWSLHASTHRKHNQLTHLEFSREVAITLAGTGALKDRLQTRPKVTGCVSQKSDGHCFIAEAQENVYKVVKIQDHSAMSAKKGIAFELLPRVS
ncbi:hypothetical protein AVEN_96960-1 [Araneus ventricosus]|uniref:Uncharacterized protein n=1 Tax=Araneus ventricosus TaxID=182803 RepID=A0A4Y2MKB3_ARAVE|nr:hypothetical protein AVEN_96960-1 [Araneus ventricosus]